MRVVVFSDVHANLAALQAVAAEIRQEAADVVLCLGDLVGYGPDPVESIELSRRLAEPVVAGNHDLDVASGDSGIGTSLATRRSHEWTRGRIPEAQLDYLARLPRSAIDPGRRFIAVHGCFLNPHHATGYVTEDMALLNLQRIRDRADWPKIAFCGHTHRPMCAWLAGGDCVLGVPTAPLSWPAGAEAVLINPGSVGQPRDRDPRAAYAVVDLESRRVSIRRVPYPQERVVARMLELGLDPDHATRLLHGY